MNENQIKRIFQPYYRAESSSQKGSNTSKRSGYGVGLTIVKRLSKRFKWTLDVDSTVDVGTSIAVNFE